ncbi:hypothetical protein L3Y25_gp058 [Gordonia phage Syleon]|uniref:Uncharacterized protein n=1 Tax=Gordonia phage Syleon TaxID=2653718 RepID=A0A5Q2WGW7_9CAUD|nr:hypothetical protein L3Y25_gp058 [Gordonia phage Syleon]QGH75787.1 hypothetical protein SEA_SYLEON_58 [Gordonia phage Syleon]
MGVEVKMPRPPKGYYWTVHRTYESFYGWRISVTLYQERSRWWFDKRIETRSFDPEHNPEWNARQCAELADIILRTHTAKLAKPDPEDAFDVNGLTGARIEKSIKRREVPDADS